MAELLTRERDVDSKYWGPKLMQRLGVEAFKRDPLQWRCVCVGKGVGLWVWAWVWAWAWAWAWAWVWAWVWCGVGMDVDVGVDGGVLMLGSTYPPYILCICISFLAFAFVSRAQW